MQSLTRALPWLLVLELLAGSGQALGAEFHVQRVQTEVVEDVFMLEARLELGLSGAPLEALENGVPLDIVLDIRVLRRIPYWLDERVAVLTQRFRLEYHALTKRYVLSNVNSGVSQTFDYLEDALASLGTINNFPLIDRGLLKPNQQYTGTLRARLDIEKLPAPLRPLAYLSSQWRLASDRYRWSLQR